MSLTEKFPITLMASAVPDIGEDLVLAASNGAFTGLPVERLVAILELLRHHEISLEKAATLAELPRERLIQLMSALEHRQ